MKILIIGDKFPDARVEKTILSAVKFGYDVGIAYWGTFNPIFDELNSLPHWQFTMGAKEQMGITSKASIQTLSKIVNDFKPDLLHANDIFNARIAAELNIKMIYDDHEFWSDYLKYERSTASYLSLQKYRRTFGLFFRKRNVKKWENKVLKKSTIICTCEAMAEHHKKYAKNVFIIPNVPSKREILYLSKLTTEERDKNLLAFIGDDISKGGGDMRKMKNILPIIEKSNRKIMVIGDPDLKSNNYVNSIGYIPHMEIYKQLLKAGIGLIGYEEHPHHKYNSANKMYMYAHCGLYNIITHQIDHKDLKYFSTFKDYDELLGLLKSDINFDPQEIIDHARQYLVWENYEENINKAYKVEFNETKTM